MINALQSDTASPPPRVTPSVSVEKAAEAKPSARAEAKIQQNSAILQASLDVSLQSKNEPLSLLLKSAINGINDLLKTQYGDDALQNAASQDNTPDGTAGRIVSLSTGFFESFKAQHEGEDPDKVLTSFMDTIRKGFQQGAKEAQDILKGMGVLSGDIADNIDKTLKLVEQGYADFEATQRKSLSEAASAAAPAAASGAAARV